MNQLLFKESTEFSLGLEIELQLINVEDYNLIACSKTLLSKTAVSEYAKNINPEVTQSMIEINSSVHHLPSELHKELENIKQFLIEKGNELNICFAGGGTHPFQQWDRQKIFPSSRYKNMYKECGYLAKQYTVFAQHIHIGCRNGNDAIYLTHMLSRYIPQLIALSASSPFHEKVDTYFDSTRANIINHLRFSGILPYVSSWEEFNVYFNKMYQLDIIKSMKDLHWDIRPQPEFGTVEIRICDMPLTLEKTVAITAYIQTLAHYILKERPWTLSPDLYLFYSYNRFQASRYGLTSDFIDPHQCQRHTLRDDIINTVEKLKPHAQELHNEMYVEEIRRAAQTQQNDAYLLRTLWADTQSFPQLVEIQSKLFMDKTH